MSRYYRTLVGTLGGLVGCGSLSDPPKLVEADVPPDAVLVAAGGKWQSVPFATTADSALSATLTTADGAPIANAKVLWTSKGAIIPAASSSYTSSAGVATMPVQAGTSLAIDTVRATVADEPGIAAAVFLEVARPSVTTQDLLLIQNGSSQLAYGAIFAGTSSDSATFPLFVGAPWPGVLAAGSAPSYQDAAWSPDGKSIALSGNRAGNFDIYVSTSNGTSLRRLTTAAEDERQPVWSPDGTRIAFARGSDIYVMNANGSSVALVTAGSQPTWSPTAPEIAFVRNGFVHRIALAGGTPQRLTSDTLYEWDPAWSPDGSSIAYSRQVANTNVMFSPGDRMLLTRQPGAAQSTVRYGFAQISCWTNANQLVAGVDTDEWWGRFGLDVAVFTVSPFARLSSVSHPDPFKPNQPGQIYFNYMRLGSSQGCRRSGS